MNLVEPETSSAATSGRWLPLRAWALGTISVTLTVLTLTACSGGEEAGTGSADQSGAQLYEQSCAACHGTDLRGTDRGPSHLSQVYAADHHGDASFRSAIENGAQAHHWTFGDMPPVGGLNSDEIDKIIAYIREQQDTQGLEPYPPN